MTCPVCGTPLGDSQTRCSGCGYSFSEPLDLQADVTRTGVRWASMIWGFMAAMTLNQVAGYLGGTYGSLSVGTAVDLSVAYLLIQPESCFWFYGQEATY